MNPFRRRRTTENPARRQNRSRRGDWECNDARACNAAVCQKSRPGIVRIDAELVDHLKRVFAPVFDVDERVIQRRAIRRKVTSAVEPNTPLPPPRCDQVACMAIFKLERGTF